MTLKPIARKISAGVLGVFFLAASAPLTAWAEDQPHMQAALQALEHAKQELQAARHDKGGHREQALQLTDKAIQQTREGIKFADQHQKHPGKDRDRDRDHDPR